MSKLLLSGILIALAAGSFPDRLCSCQKALQDDRPHGANETVEYPDKTVKRITGRVSYSFNGAPAEDVVVEIYEITPADTKLKTHEITQRKVRRAACITSNDGSFCFTNLPSGRYLLRAGPRSSRGMNEVFMKVNLDRSWWSRWFRSGRDIELGLTLGT